MKLRYFAWVRDRVGKTEEDIDPPAGVAAANRAFDVTTVHLVTAIVTEGGILRPPYDDALRHATA